MAFFVSGQPKQDGSNKPKPKLRVGIAIPLGRKKAERVGWEVSKREDNVWYLLGGIVIIRRPIAHEMAKMRLSAFCARHFVAAYKDWNLHSVFTLHTFFVSFIVFDFVFTQFWFVFL